jgi:hypothetical protein
MSQDRWYRNTRLDLDQANGLWWFNPATTVNWRLTDWGTDQLLIMANGLPAMQPWDCWELYNPQLIIKLSRLQCPWDIDITRDPVSLKEYVVTLYLQGDEVNVWMNLCGGNIGNFLNTWQS